jgi:hypothetical protein
LEFIDAGEDRFVIHQRGHAVGRTTRISVAGGEHASGQGSVDFFQVWELNTEGLVVCVREYDERDDALEAVGLRE